MAENGILDYQGMNQAIYRGATSNIIVDTQSMSIEIGAGNSSHTSNLHIECDHDANVASIQLNSNVVTEFSRSKKLIKYPRVVLPRSAVGSTYNDYRIDRSSEHVTGSYVGVQDLFNNTATDSSDTWGAGWQGSSGSYSTSTGQHSTYVTGGTTQGTGARLASNVPNGEWVSLQLPNAIQLNHVKIRSRNGADWKGQFPLDFEFWGSNNNGTTWSHIKSFSDIAAAGQATFSTFQVESTQVYSRIALVVTKIIGAGGYTASAGHAHFSISELHLYGVPEYDPEAHGTDVTVKSVANVPNTDWLEVYYDAKGLGDNSNTVNDLKPAGTPNNGTVGGNTSVTDEAFTFDGSGDYIETTLGSHISGDWTNTVSFWIAWNAIPTSGAQTPFMIGQPNTSTNGIGVDFNANSSMVYFTTSGDIVTINNVFDLITPGKWIHFTFIHTPSKKYVYWDGKQVGIWTSGGAATLPTSPTLSIGRRGSSPTNYTNAKMSNFRLFNRALTSDEIYQLYAYQKEYFGHGNLSMTLKAGRLGIGTSEPRAALDVRGDIHGGMPVFFDVRFTSAPTATRNGARIVFDTMNNSRGGGFDTTSGTFTAPIGGQYKFSYFMRGNIANQSFKIKPRINGSPSFNTQNDGTDQNLLGTAFAGGDGIQGSAVCIVKLEAGGTFDLHVSTHGGTIGSALSNYYNGFTGEYISSL